MTAAISISKVTSSLPSLQSYSLDWSYLRFQRFWCGAGGWGSDWCCWVAAGSPGTERERVGSRGNSEDTGRVGTSG